MEKEAEDGPLLLKKLKTFGTDRGGRSQVDNGSPSTPKIISSNPAKVYNFLL